MCSKVLFKHEISTGKREEKFIKIEISSRKEWTFANVSDLSAHLGKSRANVGKIYGESRENICCREKSGKVAPMYLLLSLKTTHWAQNFENQH